MASHPESVPARPGDRWPTTPAAAEALRAARAEIGNQASILDRQDAASSARLADKMRHVAESPWPHPDDVVAAARPLLAQARAAQPAGRSALYLGEGAFWSAVAHGAQDTTARTLGDLGECYNDVMSDIDAVIVRVAGTAAAQTWVPAREHDLDEAGVAMYRAMRREGHPPAAAALRAQLVTRPPVTEP